MYQRKAHVDMLNAVKSVLADVSSVRPSSEQKGSGTRTVSLQLMFCKMNRRRKPNMDFAWLSRAQIGPLNNDWHRNINDAHTVVRD